MSKIYIDITTYSKSNFVSGIQRVLQEITKRGVSDENICLVSFNGETGCYQHIDSSYIYDAYRISGNVTRWAGETILFSEMGDGAVWLDLDSVWSLRPYRSEIYPELKKYGVKIVTLVYDIVPIRFPYLSYPETSAKFILYISAVLSYADHIIVNAETTKRDIIDLAGRVGVESPEISVIPLGSDFDKKKAGASNLSDEIRATFAEKPILMVGTIEPRKNHVFLIDALDAGLNHPVIFAGRIGWNVDALIQRIKNHPLYNNRLFMVNDANDGAIQELYENSYLLAFPSLYEGYGLPIVEAIKAGLPVLASDIPVLHEAGGEYARYFSLDNVQSLVDLVTSFDENAKEYDSLREHLQDYCEIRWDDSAKQIFDTVKRVAQESGPIVDTHPKQMMVLTARNDDLLESLPFVEHFMPFITELVVCCPTKNVDSFLAEYHGRLSVRFITDEMLLEGAKLPEDHQKRNFFLRCRLMQRPELDDVFIMSDDDYRPLRIIPEDYFVQDGKYVGYYFYDLKKWSGAHGKKSSFDIGHRKTYEFLDGIGSFTLDFASHEPQIIDKRIFCEIVEKYPGIEERGFDEWSTYFNIGRMLHPECFIVKKYTTLLWPGKPFVDWTVDVVPDDYFFENYYAESYDSPDGALYGLNQNYSDSIKFTNAEKVRRVNNIMQSVRRGRDMLQRSVACYESNHKEIFQVVLSKNHLGYGLHLPKYVFFMKQRDVEIPFIIDRNIHESVTIRVRYELYDDKHCFRAANGIWEYPCGWTTNMLVVRLPEKIHEISSIRWIMEVYHAGRRIGRAKAETSVVILDAS